MIMDYGRILDLVINVYVIEAGVVQRVRLKIPVMTMERGIMQFGNVPVTLVGAATPVRLKNRYV